MKFKIYMTVFMMIIQINQLIAQDFAPIGAEWHYTERFVYPSIDYLTVVSIKDTVIKDKACRLINCDDVCWELSGNQYVHRKGDSVFLYCQKIDSFQLLYKFNAQKGDTWDFILKDWEQNIDTLIIRIDSAYQEIINENNLRAFDVTYTIKNYFDGEDLSYSSKVVEKLGDLKYLFNIPESVNVACDANKPDGLRCYEDSDFGAYSTGIADSCTYTFDYFSGINWNNKKTDYFIYPNPTKDILEIKNNSQVGYKVKILDISGKVIIMESKIGDSNINILNLPKGIYFVQILQNKIVQMNKKIIKE